MSRLNEQWVIEHKDSLLTYQPEVKDKTTRLMIEKMLSLVHHDIKLGAGLQELWVYAAKAGFEGKKNAIGRFASKHIRLATGMEPAEYSRSNLDKLNAARRELNAATQSRPPQPSLSVLNEKIDKIIALNEKIIALWEK